MKRRDESIESGCPFRAGMESHVGPFANDRGVIVEATSDALFGPDGLGFAATPWMRLISWLARSGISEQTGSSPNQTIVENCVLGWGQGAFSSQVFEADGGVDQARLAHLIAYLRGLAAELEGNSDRISARVVAAFVNAQPAQPFRTHTGLRRLRSLRERFWARFRGHIQWQSLVALCGHVDRSGTKVLTPQLLKAFFGSERSFFLAVVERRCALAAGVLPLGAAVGLLADVDGTIDREKTDREYLVHKSGLWLLSKILYRMITRTGARHEPL